MEIFHVGDDKYRVKHDGVVEVLSLNEVVFLLSQPMKDKEKYSVSGTFLEEKND